jgi:hypothetical protein
MSHKRVFVFGITGIAKLPTLVRFVDWSRSHRSHKNTSQEIIDFERDYLFNEAKGGAPDFLDAPARHQHLVWRAAWDILKEELPVIESKHPNTDILISIHGCTTRSHYGVRSSLDPSRAATLKPTHIVTLIDDIYDVWWRTQIRAGGHASVGMPTLEHLIQARRTDLVIADQVAHACNPPAQHLLISASHPCSTLWNWLYGQSPKVVYLSFPISQPRRLERQGDDTGLSEVNAFLGEAYRRQALNENLVFICPLGIDELPLRQALKAAENGENVVEIKNRKGEIIYDEDPDTGDDVPRLGLTFERDRVRWNLDSLWPVAERLSPGPPSLAQRSPLLLSELRVANGIIFSDVGWRDYRLVEQARFLAVLNPRFRGSRAVSRGVINEIEYARGLMTNSFICQELAYDPDGQLEDWYPSVEQRGTMPPPPSSQYVYRMDSVGQLFDEIDRLS